MNKDTYNSLNQMIREAKQEAWEKFYNEVMKKNPVKAESYCDLMTKIDFLYIDLRSLVEEE